MRKLRTRRQLGTYPPDIGIGLLFLRRFQIDQRIAATHAALYLRGQDCVDVLLGHSLRGIAERNGLSGGFSGMFLLFGARLRFLLRRAILGLSRLLRCAAAALILYRCGGRLLITCGLLLRRGLRHQQRLNTARCGRLKPQLFKRVQISVIQLFPLTSLNNVAASPALDVHPYGVEAVEDTSDAPLVGSSLHAVGEAAFDGFNVRILSAVPFGNEALAFKVNGNAAELCVLFPIGVPRLELVVPVFRAADLVQPILDGAVGHIGDRHASHRFLDRILQAPFQILRSKGLCKRCLHFSGVFFCQFFTS